jgi:hypothetical protein
VCRTAWTDNQPCRKDATYAGQHKYKKGRDTSMPRVKLEPTLPVFKWRRYFVP